MRNILFRGKRVDNGEWVYGSFDKCYGKNEEVIHYYIAGLRQNEEWEIIPETVGQYTGLTDKNGKNIFEGDIVSVFEGIIQKVVNENSRYAFHNSNEICCYVLSICKSKDIEVIGNIYDNPEFLEEKK